MKERALVLEIKKKTCLVMTEDGDFREAALQPGINPGQEIMIPVKRRFVYLKPWLVAASLVVMLAAAGMYRDWLSPAVAAYVSLDINPSVELALDRNLIVTGAEGLDQGGEKLLHEVKVKGMPLDTAVDKLLAAAINDNYISEGKENIILTTVTVKGNQSRPVDGDKLMQAIERPLKKAQIRAEVVVGNAPPEIRDSAHNQGLSTGRYLMYLEAEREGKTVRPEQFRVNSISSIEKENDIDLHKIMDNIKNNQKDRQKEKVVPGQKNENKEEKTSKIEGRLPPDRGKMVITPVAPDQGKQSAGNNKVTVIQPGAQGKSGNVQKLIWPPVQQEPKNPKERAKKVHNYLWPYAVGYPGEKRGRGVTSCPDVNSAPLKEREKYNQRGKMKDPSPTGDGDKEKNRQKYPSNAISGNKNGADSPRSERGVRQDQGWNWRPDW